MRLIRSDLSCEDKEKTLTLVTFLQGLDIAFVFESLYSHTLSKSLLNNSSNVQRENELALQLLPALPTRYYFFPNLNHQWIKLQGTLAHVADHQYLQEGPTTLPCPSTRVVWQVVLFKSHKWENDKHSYAPLCAKPTFSLALLLAIGSDELSRAFTQHVWMSSKAFKVNILSALTWPGLGFECDLIFCDLTLLQHLPTIQITRIASATIINIRARV